MTVLGLSQSFYQSTNRGTEIDSSVDGSFGSKDIVTTGNFYKGADRFLHNYADATSDGFNLFLGVNAGNLTLSPNGGLSSLASRNTGVGYTTLDALTTGYGNVAVGTYNLTSNTVGYYNTALGYSSLKANISGNHNTAVGFSSLLSNTVGLNNTAIGNYSLSTNDSGSSNVAVGMWSLWKNKTGHDNTAVGYNSMSKNTTGYYNVAVGNNSQEENTTGTQNTSVGNTALRFNTTGKYNTAIGTDALYGNLTGDMNTSVGVEALNKNTTGWGNVGVGYQSLKLNDVGNGNTGLGRQALYDFDPVTYEITGNVGIGYNTGRGITTGKYNTIVGARVTGLAAGLNSNIILSDGEGKIKARYDSTNWFFAGGINYAPDTSSTDAYKIVLSGDFVLSTGLEVTFKVVTANTDGATLTVNALTTKALTKCSAGSVATALATGDIIAGQIVKAVYDGTQFQIISRLAQ